MIAPSLPGYGFSEPTRTRGWDVWRIARAFIELMDRLGYARYGAQGGDWGAQVATRIGALDPEHCAAIHLNMPIADRPADPAPLTDEEQADLAAMRSFQREESGYALEQGTKPQTLGVALNDSPAGLLAWIVEKFRTWSDCDGHPENVFTRDQLLTNVMCLLGDADDHVVRAAVPGARRRTSEEAPQYVGVPTGVARYPKEVRALPALLGRTSLQRDALGRHAARRPLRRDGTARALHRRRADLLPNGALKGRVPNGTVGRQGRGHHRRRARGWPRRR